jgi:hypothetical protein
VLSQLEARPEYAVTPLGLLDAAKLASRASVAVGKYIDGQQPALAVFEAMSQLLPRMLSTESLDSIRLERINTPRLIAVAKATRSVKFVGADVDSVHAIAEILQHLQDDFNLLAGGNQVDLARMKELESFCRALAECLVDQVPLPRTPTDVRRV